MLRRCPSFSQENKWVVGSIKSNFDHENLPLQMHHNQGKNQQKLFGPLLQKQKAYEQMSHWKRPWMMWKEGSHPLGR